MYSIFSLLILFSVTQTVLAEELPSDERQSNPSVVSDKQPVNPFDCEDQFGNRGARFCQNRFSPELRFLGESKELSTDKDRRNKQ
jgi:hypothetical protein